MESARRTFRFSRGGSWPATVPPNTQYSPAALRTRSSWAPLTVSCRVGVQACRLASGSSPTVRERTLRLELSFGPGRKRLAPIATPQGRKPR